jgi:hypothetical protein
MSPPNGEQTMQTVNRNTADDTLESWLGKHPEGDWLAELAGVVRGAAGGGGTATVDPVTVGDVFGEPGPRDAAVQRLCTDPTLRRQVAAAGRLLGAPAVRKTVPRRARMRWVWTGGAALAAAGLAALILVPRMGTTTQVEPGHRAGTITAAEVEVIGPNGVLPSAPRVEWNTVLGADLYEVEVTGADGRVVFRDQTADTTLQVPPDVLTERARHFFRVRARMSVGRWVASDFHEFVVRR